MRVFLSLLGFLIILLTINFYVLDENSAGVNDHSFLREESAQVGPKMASKAVRTPASVKKIPSNLDSPLNKIEFLLKNGDFRAAVLASRNLKNADFAEGLFNLGDNGDFPQGVRINLLTESMRLFAIRGDVESAIVLHLPAIGEGAIRESLVNTLFRQSSLSADELVRLTSQLKSSDDIKRAFEGIGQRMARNEQLDLDEIRKLNDAEPFGKNAVSELLSSFPFAVPVRSYEDISRRLDETLSVLKAFGVSEKESVNIFEEIIQQSSSVYSFAIWEKVNTSSYNQLLSPDHVRLLVNSMNSKDPFKTLEVLTSDSLVSVSEKEKVNVALRALSMDQKLAKEFYETAGKSKDSDFSFFTVAFAKHATRNGEFKKASEFLENIEDKELKKDANWHNWKKQKDLISQDVSVEPRKTISQFFDGSSRYEDYMLEAAVTHWIEREPNKAADWAEENIKEMAHGPRQYVAASYAKEAAAQGDMTLARQWANLIQDEKTLTRINGILEKAEQAASN